MLSLLFDPTRTRPQPLDPEALGARLRAGDVLCCPTESVYGLLARADDAEACAIVVAAKGGRHGKEGMPLLIAHRDQLDARVRWPAWAEALAEAFWPGPLSLALPSTHPWPPSVAAPNGSVACRMPAAPFLRRLCEAAGGPLTATSANVGGQMPSSRLAQVRLCQWDKMVAVQQPMPTKGVADGLLQQAVSTVVAAAGERVAVLREGAISPSALAAVWALADA